MLKKALMENASKRKSISVMSHYKAILNDITESEQMREFWEKYQTDFDYAKDINFV